MTPEHDIARELLAEQQPLRQPDEFEAAHRRAMRALEVLQRNGGRPATVTGLGPLNRPACDLRRPAQRARLRVLVVGWDDRRPARPRRDRGDALLGVSRGGGRGAAPNPPSTDRAVRALWDTIGACGEAPEDHAIRYAVLAIVLLLVAWLAVPITIWLVVG